MAAGPASHKVVMRSSPPYLQVMSETAQIDLTPAAAARVAAIAKRPGTAPLLRLAVDRRGRAAPQGKAPRLRRAGDGGGCAGFQYRFDLAEGIGSGDVTAERDGVTLVVD